MVTPPIIMWITYTMPQELSPVNPTDSASCDGVSLSILDLVPHVPGCTGSPRDGYVAQVIAAFLLLILFTLAFPVYSGCYHSWMTSLLTGRGATAWWMAYACCVATYASE